MEQRVTQLFKALDVLVGPKGVCGNYCECEMTQSFFGNICTYCYGKATMESYINRSNICNIFKNEIVMKELQRLYGLITTGKNADMEQDIELFQNALIELNELLEGNKETVTLNCNMWSECQSSLNGILKEFQLIRIKNENIFNHDTWVIGKQF